MIRNRATWLVLVSSALLISGCTGNGRGGTAVGGGSGETMKFESYCGIDNLPAPLRQTIVIIDGHQIAHADMPGMRAANGPVIDAIEAIRKNALTPRERLKIYLAPVDGLQPRLIFTGCMPGFSKEELASLNNKTSGAVQLGQAYFGGSTAQQAQKAAEGFQAAVLGALYQAAQAAPAIQKSDVGTPFAQSALLQSIKSGGLVDLEDGAPRVFLLSDLARFDIGSPADVVAARKAGFAAAAATGLNLQRAEVDVLLISSHAPFARDFASAFLLGSEGWLTTWSSGAPSTFANPPVKMNVYAGSIDYGGSPATMNMRLATDRNGALVDSWIGVTGTTERVVPLTGNLNCDDENQCTLAQDAGGFAQVWTDNPDPNPEFAPDMPFGGMRSVDLTIKNGVADGKVYDTAVDKITGSDKPYMAFRLNNRPNGRW